MSTLIAPIRYCQPCHGPAWAQAKEIIERDHAVFRPVIQELSLVIKRAKARL